MKFYNVCTKKTFTKKDGQEKTLWSTIGTFKETDDGKKFIELNMFPDTSFYIFEQKEKTSTYETKSTTKKDNKEDGSSWE